MFCYVFLKQQAMHHGKTFKKSFTTHLMSIIACAQRMNHSSPPPTSSSTAGSSYMYFGPRSAGEKCGPRLTPILFISDTHLAHFWYTSGTLLLHFWYYSTNLRVISKLEDGTNDSCVPELSQTCPRNVSNVSPVT